MFDAVHDNRRSTRLTGDLGIQFAEHSVRTAFHCHHTHTRLDDFEVLFADVKRVHHGDARLRHDVGRVGDSGFDKMHFVPRAAVGNRGAVVTELQR